MRRSRSLLRRVFELIFTFLIVSMLSFALMRLSPVDPATAYAVRNMSTPTPEQIEQVRAEMGLDQPLLVQYGAWVWGALHLDFGESLVNGKPALGELLQAVPVTLKVVGLTACIEAVLSIFFGCLLHRWKGKKRGTVLTLFSLAVISIPGFYVASVYLDLFAVKWQVISVVGNSGFWRYVHPALCLSLATSFFYARMLSSALNRECREDYVFYARSRGLSETRILLFHTLPHGVISLIPSFLQSVGLSLAGAAMIERVFSLPGLGYLIIDSVLARDTPMVHLEVLFLALMLVILNILSDWIQELLQKRNLAKGELTL